MLEGGALSDPQVKETLKDFVRLVIDHSKRDRGRELQQMGIRGFPTLVFLDSQGDVTGQLTGSQPASRVIAAARVASQ